MVIGIPPLTPRYAGSRISAAIYEQDVTDSINFLTNPPIFVGYQGTSQSVPNTSWTALALDTSTTDPYTGHSSVTNTSRWTCPSGVSGWYTACGIYAPAANSSGFRAVRLQVNGSPVLGAASYGGALTGAEPGLATPTKDIFLNSGDYLEVAGYQNSGGSLGTSLDADLRTGLWLRWSHA